MQAIFPDHRVIRLQQTTSTNAHMLQLSVGDQLPEGSVVVADNQTQGRGQGDNVWESEPYKNLTFTILLYPTFVKASQQFWLSKIISLAVYDFISQKVADASVKWPNDVYVGDKKIAGILIENFIEGAYLTKTIAGIGININQEKFTPDTLNPVSLRQLTGDVYQLTACLEELIGWIAQRYQQLSDMQQMDALHADYLNHMYRFKQWGRFSAGSELFDAMITGINKYGMLEMTTSENEQKTFGFKEVSFE